MENQDFNRKVQEAVESYMRRRETQSEQLSQLKLFGEKENLLQTIQKLIMDIITKMTDKVMGNIMKECQMLKRQMEQEIFKLKDMTKMTHQRSYSNIDTIDKETILQNLQQKMQKHENQISTLIQHQSNQNIKSDQSYEIEVLQSKIKEKYDDLCRQIKEKHNTYIIILKDFEQRISQLSAGKKK